MIDDLLERIEKDRERVNEYRLRMWEEKRKNMADEDEYDDDRDEDPDEEEPESMDIQYVFPEKRDEVPFDENVEFIDGHMFKSREFYGRYFGPQTKPLRYMVSPDNPWYFEIDGVVFSRETGLLVLFPPGKGEEYSIPDDDRITGIGERAFAANTILKKINLGSRILYIGDNAFTQCTALREICLPPQVEYVGSGVFADCASLERAEIQSGINVIPDRFFRRDAVLRSVVLPDGIETIGRSAFEDCAALSTVRPCTVAAAEGEAVFPDVRTIRWDAFSGCVSLRAFRLDKAEDYKAHCFRNCLGLESITFGPATLKLGKELLLGADHLKTIRFSCAPDFTCASDALPENVQYVLDTEAYLKVARPHGNKILFRIAVENLATGQPASPNAVNAAVRAMKRNSSKLHDFFLKDERILGWILEQKIPNITDCAAMLCIIDNKRPQQADMIREYMNSMFTETEIRCAEETMLAKVSKERVIEEKVRRIRETMPQDAETVRVELLAGQDISLEEMNLSVRSYNCLKRAGYNYLSDIVALSYDNLLRIRNLGRKCIMEIVDKVEAITGLKIPSESDDY